VHIIRRSCCSYMNESGECWPKVATLARAMRVDPRTVRRAVSALVEHGWLISVPRPGETNLYQAVLPEYGLELLLARREKRATSSTTADWQEAVYRVLDAACAAFGISRVDWAGTKEWARVEGRTRQILQRLGGPALDTDFLIKALTYEPPVAGIRDPVGFLLARLSIVARQIPAASGKRKTTRVVPSSKFEKLMEEIIRKQREQTKHSWVVWRYQRITTRIGRNCPMTTATTSEVELLQPPSRKNWGPARSQSPVRGLR